MTQRGAVFVGCRLIAIYMVFEGAATLVGTLISVGYMQATMMGMSNRGMGNQPFMMMFQGVIFPMVARCGLAVFLWAGAGMLSRAAALQEEGDT